VNASTRSFHASRRRASRSHTLTSLAALERGYASIGKRGYALDNEQLQLFVRCVAAHIRNAAGKVFAAISLFSSVDR
jgi:DNA-binding IclR family transcriptional regulator